LREIADAIERTHRLGGRDAAHEFISGTTSSRFDARLSKTFLEEREELFEGIEDPNVFDRFLELEGGTEWVAERGLEDVARALAVAMELRTPVFLGHSMGVEALATRAAREYGLGASETRWLRLAALLHDVGRVSVPNRIWTRPGPLDWGAWERVRLHPHYSGRVLDSIPSLSGVGEIASAAHERIDGSGYPRGRSGRTLSPAARLLAVADVASAMSEDRAHRPAFSRKAVVRELASEASLGRLDARAADAVLAALGVPDRVSRLGDHGLSERELEVSRLLARGKSDKEIGADLSISPRTVQVHVGRILDKLGVRSRAGAAVWLIEHDLAD
jgi:HD-GYP domain-containing protein (c-di-GMP phosphodiesterase class II)